jgi:hypothetical protein
LDKSKPNTSHWNGQEICYNKTCKNNGTCIRINNDDERCICEKSFYGQNCELVDVCSSAPCGNNGICTQLLNEKYVCKCHQNFTGTNCEITRLNYNYTQQDKIKVISRRTKFKFIDDFEEIGYCPTAFCRSNGICVVKKNRNNFQIIYSCVCSKLKSGANCEISNKTY